MKWVVYRNWVQVSYVDQEHWDVWTEKTPQWETESGVTLLATGLTETQAEKMAELAEGK